MLNADVTRKTYFGEKARVYDEKNTSTGKRKREEDALRKFLEGTSGTVLDIPVGTGHFLPMYAEAGLSVIGMDVSSEMMDQAKAKFPDADLRRGDVLRIQLPENTVDVAVCIRLLSLIETDEMIRAMSELGRVASKFVICTIKVEDEKRGRNRSVTHPLREFRKAVSSAGLDVEDVEVIKSPDHFIYKLRCV